MKQLLYFTALLMCMFTSAAFCQLHRDSLVWQEGYLDIHHINTARCNSTFFVFPDGTTLLFDAGAKKVPVGKEHEYFPIPLHDSLSVGALIAHYIKKMTPASRVAQIDYAVISHFHNDHYGQIDSSSRKSINGSYRLSGVTEVAEHLPIKTLIDRNFPDYDFPLDLKTFYKTDATFINYITFIKEQKNNYGLRVQALTAGSKNQITLKLQPDKFRNFSVRNVKANEKIWSGKGSETFEYQFQRPLIKEDDFENALTLALKISYGSFDYYTGGDLTGLTQWGDFDLETPVAKVVGKVEALALNHHGYYDASSDFFLQTLSPSVIVHQVIHDPHYQADVLKRLSAYPFHVFTYNMHETTKKAFPAEVEKLYKSTEGHIVIRVVPGGKQYYVYTLDDRDTDLKIIEKFGPYNADTTNNKKFF